MLLQGTWCLRSHYCNKLEICSTATAATSCLPSGVSFVNQGVGGALFSRAVAVGAVNSSSPGMLLPSHGGFAKFADQV